MPAWPSPPATRILSWNQLVREADPNFTRLSLQPWVYSYSNGRLFVDPLPLYNFVFGEGLGSNGGVLIVTDATGWPTDPSGLLAGQLWSNGGDSNGKNGTVTVIPGIAPNPSAEQQFFGQISASQLLALGGGNFQFNIPSTLNQIWNNGGELNIVVPPFYLFNLGGVLILTEGAPRYPTSEINLLPGQLWSNGGVVSVNPGLSYDPSQPPLYYGFVSAADLLAAGGASLPTTSPPVGSLQLWNFNDEVYVA